MESFGQKVMLPTEPQMYFFFQEYAGELNANVNNLEKKKGESYEVNDSQSMHQTPDSRMGPNKYPVAMLPGHWISIVQNARRFTHNDAHRFMSAENGYGLKWNIAKPGIYETDILQQVETDSKELKMPVAPCPSDNLSTATLKQPDPQYALYYCGLRATWQTQGCTDKTRVWFPLKKGGKFTHVEGAWSVQ